MNLHDYEGYIIPLLLLLYAVWRFSKFRKMKSILPKLIADGAIIVDVRSAAEFQRGSNPSSVNIPLNELGSRVQELDKNKHIILCCASGARSAAAVGILKKNGFENVLNAGSWSSTLV